MNAVASTEVKSVDQAIWDVGYPACILLAHATFGEWLALSATEFSHRMTISSPEIRRQMTWYEQDVAGLKAMIDLLPKHNTDHGRLTRHATIYAVDADLAQGEASATTSFACYRTMLDGINSHIDSGETQLFLI